MLCMRTCAHAHARTHAHTHARAHTFSSSDSVCAGVSRVRVGLLSERATVVCDPSLVAAEVVAERVRGLGYTAEVLTDKKKEEGTLDLTVSGVGGAYE